MRDRLLGTYEVKPVLQKLRSTLLGAGGLLLTSAVALLVLIKSGADVDGMYGAWRGTALSVPCASACCSCGCRTWLAYCVVALTPWCGATAQHQRQSKHGDVVQHC